MEKSKVIAIITFILILMISIYITSGIYQHRVEMAQLEIVKNNRLKIENVKLRLVKAWQDYLNQTTDLTLKIQANHQQSVSQSLSLIEASRDDIDRAFYFNNEMIYLSQWSKKRQKSKTEIFTVGILDHPQFKLAEIMEFRDQDFSGAIKIYEKLWLQNPDNSYATNALARCLYKREEYERALKLYRQIYQQDPQTHLQEEVPLGLTAGLQMINIYDQQGDDLSAGTFGLNVYENLLNNNWGLSEVKQQFYLQKIKAWLKLLIYQKKLKRKYLKLQKQEKLILADKKYIRLIQKKIIPFIEASYERRYYIYHHKSHRPSGQFLLIIPNQSNFLLLQMNFKPFVQFAVGPTIDTLEQESLEIGIENKNELIKSINEMDQLSSTFRIDQDFPDLTIKIAQMKTVIDIIDEETTKIMQRYLIGSIVMLIILAMFFLVFYNQIRLAEMKTEFVTQVSHELKTPLTSLRAFAELIQDQPDLGKSKLLQYCGFMQTESMRLARLIENLFDITRIEKRKLQYKIEKHKLATIVQESVTLFKQSNEELTQPITISVNHPGTVMLDKDAFIRVMLNILDNARKYSEVNTPITVKVKALKNNMMIVIEDQGVGMQRSELRNVFKKFYQAKRTYEEKFKGVGLGLAIVKTIVRAHQGSIKIESQLNKGTCVKIVLPKIPVV